MSYVAEMIECVTWDFNEGPRYQLPAPVRESDPIPNDGGSRYRTSGGQAAAAKRETRAEMDREILATLARRAPSRFGWSTQQVHYHTGIRDTAVKGALGRLEDAGLVRVDERNGARYHHLVKKK